MATRVAPPTLQMFPLPLSSSPLATVRLWFEHFLPTCGPPSLSFISNTKLFGAIRLEQCMSPCGCSDVASKWGFVLYPFTYQGSKSTSGYFQFAGNNPSCRKIHKGGIIVILAGITNTWGNSSHIWCFRIGLVAFELLELHSFVLLCRLVPLGPGSES